MDFFRKATLFFLILFCSCQSKQKITVYEVEKGYRGSKDDVRLFNAFPKQLYFAKQVKDLGSFYVDSDGSSDYIKGCLRQGIPWEGHLIKVMQDYVSLGSKVLDIGAHIGTHTVSLSSLVGEKGKVIAFEPQKKIYSELTHNLKLNDCKNVIAYRCALGDEMATIEMCPATPGNEGGTPVGSGGDQAEMATLDSFDLKDISFIKLDVENTEYQVLLGAKKTLMESRPIVMIEIMGNYEYECSDREELCKKTYELLESYGYVLNHICGSDWLAIPTETLQ